MSTMSMNDSSLSNLLETGHVTWDPATQSFAVNQEPRQSATVTRVRLPSRSSMTPSNTAQVLPEFQSVQSQPSPRLSPMLPSPRSNLPQLLGSSQVPIQPVQAPLMPSPSPIMASGSSRTSLPSPPMSSSQSRLSPMLPTPRQQSVMLPQLSMSDQPQMFSSMVTPNQPMLTPSGMSPVSYGETFQQYRLPEEQYPSPLTMGPLRFQSSRVSPSLPSPRLNPASYRQTHQPQPGLSLEAFESAASPVQERLSSPAPEEKLEPTGKPYNTYQEAASVNKYNDLLTKYGYRILDNVIDDGKLTYIKVVDLLGDIAYIKVDDSEGLTLQNGNRTYVKPSKNANLVESVTQDTMLQNSGNVIGSMIECANGLCMVTRNDDGTSDANNFMITQRYIEDQFQPEDSPVGYPIVTLDEVVNNNNVTLLNIRKTTEAIQQATTKQSIKSIAELAKYVEVLNTNITRLATMYAKVQRQRSSEANLISTNIARLYRQQSSNGLTAKDQATLTTLTKHAYDLNVANNDLLTLINKVTHLKAGIVKKTAKVNASYWKLFLLTRDVLDDGLSKELKMSTAWGLPEAVGDQSLNMDPDNPRSFIDRATLTDILSQSEGEASVEQLKQVL